ncbi:MAG: hypothetical protein IPK17_11630 [Chloroflexi bacterium]|uniref:hypothetical protein n=1 Tax=Candidatus Flexifilum breve TaxID=3140694 RepID=UPI003135F439|nr:hypothetical protein [Chloroflexota bacterium]
MPEFNRERLELSYQIFQRFALDDQRKFYKNTLKRNRTAASQVNRLRALFALLTGLASALAAFIVIVTPTECETTRLVNALSDTGVEVQIETTPEAGTDGAAVTPQTTPATPPFSCSLSNNVIPLLLIVAVLAPALGGAFGTLADLYQWDRLVNIYDVALENLEVADAKSPLADMDDVDYLGSLKAYAHGTLGVMRDETAQWGQIIRTPESLQRFVDAEREIAGKVATGLPKQIGDYLSQEMERIQAATEANKRLLEEIRAQFAQDAGTKPDDETDPKQ